MTGDPLPDLEEKKAQAKNRISGNLIPALHPLKRSGKRLVIRFIPGMPCGVDESHGNFK
jgi:hypothetical protein